MQVEHGNLIRELIMSRLASSVIALVLVACGNPAPEAPKAPALAAIVATASTSAPPKQVDAAKATTADRIAAYVMHGPFASIQAFCEAFTKGKDGKNWSIACAPDALDTLPGIPLMLASKRINKISQSFLREAFLPWAIYDVRTRP